ncbi:tripartite tricarboxylate transporter substrate binding protein [Bordetella sp. N]|uniref:Bug family tripartite tricarboxylate transporter substrate binding protein n=1 Tax=Bordetella sp. N TaxID=1746199 RepID=UPI00070EF986|nr:tripartite tricarboxylate transporter substrate binding protein [Bordetella sp. N]ALM84603.1 ABC transporter substrate-binding protein [Bordetella sp. N]
MKRKYASLRSAAAAILFGSFMAASSAQAEYPDKPITFVVPAVAGGAADVLTRVLTAEMTKRLGQPVIVLNKPGASGAIGLDAIAKAKPDGYTIGMHNLAILVGGLTAAKTPYRPEDLIPIAKMFTQPNLLAVNPNLPVHSVAELVTYAKAHPHAVFYGSSGTGTSLHVVTALFAQSTGIQIEHVPYKSAPFGEADLASGQIQMMISNLTSLGPQAKAGRVRALAITGPKRSPMLPDVPTIAEAGVPAAQMETWGGVVGPKGLPDDIVGKLNTTINQILADPEVVRRYDEMGSAATPQTTAQFDALIKSESARWGAVVKQANITAD